SFATSASRCGTSTARIELVSAHPPGAVRLDGATQRVGSGPRVDLGSTGHAGGLILELKVVLAGGQLRSADAELRRVSGLAGRGDNGAAPRRGAGDGQARGGQLSLQPVPPAFLELVERLLIDPDAGEHPRH